MKTPVEFLNDVSPAGEHGAVLAIRPLGGDPIVCAYVGGQPMGHVETFLKEHSDDNLYWAPNPLRHPIHKKAAKKDVKSLRWIYCDIDDPTALPKIKVHPLPPTMIVMSGNGFNVYWLLADPVPVHGNFDELEVTNKRVMEYFGADHCFNIDRILRLPFTINRLTLVKLKKNPGGQPTQATLIECDLSRTYTLDQFAAPLDALDEPKDQSRSADLMKKVAAGMASGLTDEQIHADLDSHPHALDQKDAVRAVQRCIDKIRKAQSNIVDEINTVHALIWVSGKLMVMWPEELEGGMPRISELSDLKNEWKPRQLGKTNPIDLWLGSPNRRHYRILVNRPGVADVSPDYNLFRGWGVTPDSKGSCRRFLAHLRDVVCDGDDKTYEYVLQWLANSVQKPEDKPGTAITMQSDQGAGKGMVGAYIAPIYGDHFTQLASSDLLLGRFNDWLAGKVMVFGDESAWPGDRRGVDKLKALITEPKIMVERKHVPAITIENNARFIFATNHEHSAPAEVTDRRFIALYVSSKRIGDHQYWERLVAERDAGGPAALLHYLLNYPLTLNLRETPKTSALTEQKLLSLDDVGQFWREMLMTNEHRLPDLNDFQFDSIVQPTTLHAFYLDFARKERVGHPASLDALGVRLRKYLPELTRRKSRGDESDDLGIRHVWGRADRVYVYVLPHLSEARRAFEKRIGDSVDWPDDANEDLFG